MNLEVPAILCLVPSSPEYLLDGCVPAIKAQTVPVKKLIVASLRDGNSIDERVVKTLNRMLSQVNLGDYDYILRVDGDCIIPRNFVEAALSTDSDLYGSCGCAMLLRVSTFKKYMQGEFQYLDDSYLRARYTMFNLKMSRDIVPYYHKPKKRQSLKQLTAKELYRGRMLYVLGWELVHVTHHVAKDCKREGSLRFAIPLLGYVIAWTRRTPKLDVASWVYRYQVGQLVKKRF